MLMVPRILIIVVPTAGLKSKSSSPFFFPSPDRSLFLSPSPHTNHSLPLLRSPPLFFISPNSRLISWGYYNASDPSKKSLKKAQKFAKDFINRTTGWANKIHKPILLEEFGMARDAWRNPSDPAYKYNPGTPTSHKDTYYHGIFQQITHLVHQGRHAGANFWAYGGLGRSTDEPNQFNMTWLGGKWLATLDRSLIPLFSRSTS